MSLFATLGMILVTLGSLAVLAMGPLAINSVGKGEAFFPLVFRVLALLVFASHVQVQYFNYFEIERNYSERCGGNLAKKCTLGKVLKVSKDGDVDRKIAIEFYDEKNHLNQWELIRSKDFYEIPEVGESIILEYNYKPGDKEVDFVKDRFQFKRGWGVVLGPLFVWLLIILYSLWIESKVRLKFLQI